MFKNDWINGEYVSKYVYGRDEPQEKVEKYTPELVETITGIPTKQLMEAAEIIRTETLLSTLFVGVYQSNGATASAYRVNNISLLRGMFRKPACGVFQMNGQPTPQVI
jgi:anaerobic selenocysteine-containing dehydrogenase